MSCSADPLSSLTGTDEWFRVMAGTVHVKLNGVEHAVTPDSGEFHIPAGTPHSVRIPRGTHGEFSERADPDPVRKAEFLRHFMSRGGQKEEMSFIQVMRVFYEDGAPLQQSKKGPTFSDYHHHLGDTYPSTGNKMIDAAILKIFGGFFGSFIGLGALRVPDKKAA
jgi:hypothetical protein